MPFKTRDVGGGVQQLVFEPGQGEDAISQASKTLGLVNLINQIQSAPLDRKIKQIDTALKGNQLLNIDIENEKNRVDLISAQGREFRERAKFGTEQLKSVLDLYIINFKLGDTELQRSFPGSQSVQNKDGSIGIALPTSTGITEAFTIDPRKVSKPEKIAQIEKQFRDRWENRTKLFRELDRQFKNIKDAQGRATAQGDIAIIFAFMKMNDPTSVVREGEQAMARNAPNVPSQILNMYNRALTSSAPFFGGPGSTDRKKFVDIAQDFHNNALEEATALGKNLIEISSRAGADPQNVITTAGDLTFENLFQDLTGPAGQLPPGTQPPQTQLTTVPGETTPIVQPPIEAGVRPGVRPRREPPEDKSTKTRKDFNRILQQNLFIPSGQ